MHLAIGGMHLHVFTVSPQLEARVSELNSQLDSRGGAESPTTLMGDIAMLRSQLQAETNSSATLLKANQSLKQVSDNWFI